MDGYVEDMNAIQCYIGRAFYYILDREQFDDKYNIFIQIFFFLNIEITAPPQNTSTRETPKNDNINNRSERQFTNKQQQHVRRLGVLNIIHRYKGLLLCTI